MNSDAVHPFEKSCLGQAPFRIVECDMPTSTGLRVVGEVGGATLMSKPGGTCAHCGTAILYRFRIASADGRFFWVGSDCVRKTADSRLVDQAKRALARMKSAADAARAYAAITLLNGTDERAQAVCSALRSRPHPNARLAAAGKTEYDFLYWVLRNAGSSGQKKAVRTIEALAGAAS